MTHSSKNNQLHFPETNSLYPKENKKKTQKRLFWQQWRNKQRNKKRNMNRMIDKQRKKESIKQKVRENIFDLTNKSLGEGEIELLRKGERFCIANDKVDTDRLKADIYNYSRRLRLHEEFREPQSRDIGSEQKRCSVTTQSPTQNNLKLTNKRHTQSSQNRMPRITDNQTNSSQTQRPATAEQNQIRRPNSTSDPENQNRNLIRYNTCIQEESLLIVQQKTKFKDNIDTKQREALTCLKKKIGQKKIVVTKADKGSGIVIVDYDLYIKKGTKYIEKEALAYTQTDTPPKQIISNIVKERDKILKTLVTKHVIPPETGTYCTEQLEEKITGLKFYYKVHKDTNIDTMPLRPLQSCIAAPTHHLSQVLTDILQPLLTVDNIPTYIQDSNQLLYRLELLPPLPQNSTIISSDVSALLGYILNSEGMKAITEFLETKTHFTNKQIETIVKALELVITKNYVMWNNKVYKQTRGVAMGTPVAVAYANISMHSVDSKIRFQAPFIIEHIRYINDNLFIIPKKDIEKLMNIANQILNPYIKFTYEKIVPNSEKGLTFLDTQLFISSEQKIETRLYTKKTDKHAYLLLSSYHPTHVTKNIPQAVFNRIRRICSRQKWFEADATNAREWLENRGYNHNIITKAISNSNNKDRWEMIEAIEKKRTRKNIDKDQTIYEIPFITTYGQKTKRIKKVLKRRQLNLD